MIRIADNLSLPLDYVTQTGALLAVRGAGKTNAAAVIAEGMHKARLRFVVIDPVGSWYGLRSAADGKGKGLPIPIFGGRHGDVPLERGAGQLVADLVVDQGMTCVLDCSEFSEGDKVKFLLDFARRVYRRNTEPLHLFLEEADDFIPQRPFREEAQLLRAWTDIVRRGRSRGLGMTMITQRSAALNKNVLTQVEVLFALRSTSPQDRDAIRAWVDYQGASRDMIATLPKLKPGEAWVCSPSWLEVFQRIRFRRRSTFDSGATPKTGKRSRPAATLADVDLSAIRTAMAETIERAEAEDPKLLRRRIVELERELKAERAKPVPAPQVVTAQVLWASPDYIAAVRTRSAELAKLADDMEETNRRAKEDAPKAVAGQTAAAPARRASVAPAAPAGRPSAVRPAPARRASGEGVALPKGERVVLIAIAQHGDAGVTRQQLTVLTGYKRSTRDAYLQRLREKGFIDGASDSIVATQAGVDALGSDYEPLPTGDRLREYWLEPGRLPEGEARVLRALCDAYPVTLPRQTIDDVTGFKRSTRDAYLQRLGSRKLVTVIRGEARASEELFG